MKVVTKSVSAKTAIRWPHGGRRIASLRHLAPMTVPNPRVDKVPGRRADFLGITWEALPLATRRGAGD